MTVFAIVFGLAVTALIAALLLAMPAIGRGGVSTPGTLRVRYAS